ncbi:lipopolysaccharide-induced tumor necrosis factor-alpha factor homolog [Pangasianodon hypophthalmus]|uniref:lipopolysaccharide-induced tumor necrosis factor-alpha factor homolog n=1 Tax=Pangasianodon hypophthalmus TaxID=310915 RepID=UPI00230817CF|nr:lipopolysaccharide-induced tumor necrosis factor-alpha factor homolog [Pangasianodon hypophthalmus]
MEFNPPPPYPGPIDPTPGAAYPPLSVVQDTVYPAPPKYSTTVVQPAPMIMQPELTVVQPTTVIQTQPALMVVNPVVVQSALTETPAPMMCTYCHQQIVTVTNPTTGLLVWTIFGVLFLLGIWPCCLIPFCVDSCKDVQHKCPSCGNVLHIYRRM